MSLKILVSGDVEGRLDQLYKRIESIQKKSGQFDMLLCVGDFFGSDDTEWLKYSTGGAQAPIPTFILGPNKPHHRKHFTEKDGGDLCDNITYLGRSGVYTGSTGLKLAYLSGLDGDQEGSDTRFTKQDTEALTVPLVANSKFKGVDILLTSAWPTGVEKYAAPHEPFLAETESTAISQLAVVLKPRYHFTSGQGIFYERQPYRNHQVLAGQPEHVSRFIALAKVGNPSKKKWLYAFNITPMSELAASDLLKQPPDVTECPYKSDPKGAPPKEKTGDQSAPQFFYDMQSASQKRMGDKKGGPAEKKPNKQPRPTGPCWFCLGSPEVEKHLIVSVGTQTYLSLAKGGLTPDHLLICPIGHYQCMVKVPSDVKEEIDNYKAALKKMFKAENKAVVFFERNFKTQHLQIQAIPINRSCVPDVNEAFMECAGDNKIELHEIPEHSDLKQIVPPGAPYFYAELPSGEKLLHRISKGFPLNFGREAVTGPSILDMPEKVDWRSCKCSKEEETSMAASFRDSFKKYDFNLL